MADGYKELKLTSYVMGSFRDVFIADDNELTEPAKMVVEHLGNFCGVNETSTPNDPIEMARYAGRREMYNEIKYCLDSKQLYIIDNEIKRIEEIVKGDSDGGRTDDSEY